MRELIISLFFILSFTIKLFCQVSEGLVPKWVTEINYLESQIDENEINEGVYTLLFDNQINIPKETVFYRFSTKITNNVGVQNGSTINISFDPKYQTLKFHKIDIKRNGEVINKLDLSNIQTMRRELNAENYLYDGSLSAIMNITDVRINDIIDYSYSIIGFNPIHGKIFSGNFYLNDLVEIGKINTSFLSEKELNYKSFNTSIKPNISKVNGLFKYHWSSSNTKKLDYEENVPTSNLLYETIFVSEYDSWKSVIDWGIDVFKTNKSLSAELQTKIEEINKTNHNEGEKIKATLNFVQNEIRYLGLESGIGSYKPFSPNKVFNQRFGDCKDKSLLMVTMLNNIGVEAYLMLVNTSLKHKIKDLLPSPKFFDHCVVKVVTNNKIEYYYDPTIPNQGGEFDSTHFPNYEYGLVLKNGNDSFDEFKSSFENKIETLEEFKLQEVGKGASLKVTTTYYEYEADNIRNYFKNNSLYIIDKEYQKFYSNSYYNVTSLHPPSFEDDLGNNIFKVKEDYQIDSIWQPIPEKKEHIAVNFIASNLLNTLYVPSNDLRKFDLAIVYPIIREHRIKVQLPMNWNINNDKLFVNSPGFYFEWTANYNQKEKLIDLNYYLKPQKSFISPKEYEQYTKDVQKIDQSLGYYIFMPKNYNSINLNSNNNFFDGFAIIFKFIAILIVAIIIVLFGFWFLNRKESKEKS